MRLKMSKSKKELVSLVAAGIDNVTEAQVKEVVNSFLNAVMQAMAEGEKVTLQGFGVFEAPLRPAKTRFNPLVQREIHTPARRLPKFSAAKPLKDFLAQPE